MPVYATHGDPTFEASAITNCFFSPTGTAMSRRLALAALASLALSACASSTTAPSREDSTATRAPIVTSGSYDAVPTDSAGRIVTSGSY